MGFEESYGYLSGTHVRDKDAVVSAMLICELAAAYKEQGSNLYDASRRSTTAMVTGEASSSR